MNLRHLPIPAGVAGPLQQMVAALLLASAAVDLSISLKCLYVGNRTGSAFFRNWPIATYCAARQQRSQTERSGHRMRMRMHQRIAGISNRTACERSATRSSSGAGELPTSVPSWKERS